MKLLYVSLAVIAVISYNGMLIKRDKKMFDSYNQACDTLPKPHPDCRYAK